MYYVYNVRQSANQDLINQVKRLIGTTNAVIERYARGFEELDGIRLNLEEIRVVLNELVEEHSRWADKISERLDRLERLEILDRTGNMSLPEARRIKQDVADENHLRALRQELAQQVRNLDKANQKAAKYGMDIPVKLANEIEMFEERIKALREELD